VLRVRLLTLLAFTACLTGGVLSAHAAEKAPQAPAKAKVLPPREVYLTLSGVT
jgi:hypothetical protein